MASSIDRHPQRQKIIDALLAGESLRSISERVSPPVSFSAIHRYRSQVVAPALKNAAFATKVLARTDLVDPLSGPSPELARVINDTSAALKAAPVLAVRESRLARLEDRSKRLDLVMTERAAEMTDVPGGKSGLLVRRLKSIGSGESAQVVEEYELDRTLLAEAREHEKQAAMELGQWQEGSASAGNSTYIYMPQVSIAVGQVIEQLDPSCDRTDVGQTVDVKPVQAVSETRDEDQRPTSPRHRE